MSPNQIRFPSMQSLLQLAVLLAVALSFSCPLLGTAASKAQSPRILAIVDVSVLPMNRDVVLEHQTVVIQDQRITAIGPKDSVVIPDGAEVTDGKGRFLMPGLSDMHAHLRRKKGQMPGDYLRQGITTIRNMAGDSAHLRVRESILSGKVDGPLFYTSGQPLTGSEFFPSHRLVATAEEGRAAVREQSAAGYEYVKIYSLLGREAFDGIAQEAKALGMPIVGHVSDQVGLQHSFEMGLSSVEHFYGYFWLLESETSDLNGEWDPRRLFHAVEIDPAKLLSVARMTAEAGVWNCPTLWRKNNYQTAPSVKEAWADPALRAMAEQNRLLLLGALHDAGAGLLTGTDDKAEILHQELELFVEAGLTPYETLRASSVNAARYLAADDDFGTVEVGKRANLVLLEANPLEDIRRTRQIAGVMMNGKWFTKP